MKITAKVKRKLVAAKKKAGKFLSNKKNRKYIFMAIGLLLLFLIYSKFGKRKTTTTTTPGSGGKVDTGDGNTITYPIPPYTWTPGTESSPKGVYSTKVAGRTYHYNKTPEFAINITENGITDVTPGLTRSGGICRLGDKNVFYAMGYFPVDTTLENYYHPDGIVTIQQYPVDPAICPNYAAFKAKYNGWNNGVNSDNSRLSQIFISIHSDTPTSNTLVPSWLKLSRQLIFPSVAVPKDWHAWGKHISIGHFNVQDSRAKYIALGAQPYNSLSGNPEPGTHITYKKPDDSIMTEQQMYDLGTHIAYLSGNSEKSYMSSEIAENMQGKDAAAIYGKTAFVYKGIFDRVGSKKAGWGDYGGDQFYGYVRTDSFQYMSRQDYEKNLTTHLYNGYDVRGFSDGPHEFFTKDHYKYRGVNISYYLWNQEYNIPLELAWARNKVKTGTMTYQNQNNECDLSFYTATKPESFVTNAAGQHVAIENARTGEIIPFPGGEMATWYQQCPTPWDEQFNAHLWSFILLSGAAMWDAPNSTLGYDETKFHIWGERAQRWRKAGTSQWQDFNYGQEGKPNDGGKDGAPLTSGDGMMFSLFAAPQDAALAASEVMWPLRNRIQTTRWAAYTSSNGNFTPNPGTAGLHMNGGNMPINRNLFVERDILDVKKATAVDCQGEGGGVVFYHNNYLAPHLYDDNVSVNGHYIGRVHGRQTACATY